MENNSISYVLKIEIREEDGVVELERKVLEETRRGGQELLKLAMAEKERQGRAKLGSCQACRIRMRAGFA